MIKRGIKQHHNIDPTQIMLLLSTILFVGTLAFRINCAGKLAVKNEELKVLSEKKSVLEKEVALLEYEDSKYSSLKNIEDSAIKLGFVNASGSLISMDLTSGAPIASNAK